MIRQMRASDYEAMVAIYRQSLEKGNATFQMTCPTYVEWDASHIPTCRLVFEEDGRVVGYAMIAPTSSRDCYRGVAESSVYVDETYRRRGIGRTLLSALMAEARAEGFWMLYAAIFSNNEASIRLHKACGFRVIGTRERIARDRFGQWQSTTVMEWRNDID